MRLHFWNKRPKIDRLLKQLASYKSVLAREFQDQFFNYQQINYLPKFLVVVLHTLKTSACVNVYRASCMNTRSIFWCLFQKRSLMLSPILPFKKFSCLHSPCTKFSNLTNILWRTYFLIGEISFLRLWGLNRGNWLRWFRRFPVRTFRPVETTTNHWTNYMSGRRKPNESLLKDTRDCPGPLPAIYHVGPASESSLCNVRMEFLGLLHHSPRELAISLNHPHSSSRHPQ